MREEFVTSELNGKVALVTGAGRGLGEELQLNLQKMDAKSSLIIKRIMKRH